MSDLLFAAEPRQRDIARELHALVRDQPLISPHGHVDPGILAEDRPFPDPAQLLIVPDHYVTRMLLSQGIPPARLGVPTRTGEAVETDISTPLRPDTADDVYDAISERLGQPAYRPRALFERFNIEVLATTESPLDDLSRHAKLAADGWGGPGGRVITTFRPDDVVDMEFENWAGNVARLGEITGCDTGTYEGYLDALRARRQAFIAAGATSSDHGHPTARTAALSPAEAATVFDRGLRGEATAADAETFRAAMLVEFARMSVDDGLVMQLHPGAVRNHNKWLYATHGRDVGGDIPQATEYLHALTPLLDAFGNDPRLRLVLYTLDEYTFTRELAPLAGGYAAVYLGAPWWFLDSPEVLRRYRESVTESAGFYNTAGFVDDTRAFCSIPVRHDVARRVDAAYLARLVAEHRLGLDEAAETIVDLAYHLPKKVFRLDEGRIR
jgi:glucuronate isomerase